ncbi:MAG: iron-regulated protein [Deltaproteobacteria bacterium]|nr:iron-regulated protein [Deltaproteobacteria bacterium]
MLPSNAEVAPVLETYAAIVHAGYEDAHTRGEALDTAVDAFVAAPSEPLLVAARDAWVASRPPYLQTEMARFYGGPIDDPDNDQDGRINSWPLDEAYLDYVQGPPPDFEELVGGLVNDATELPTIDEASLVALNGAGAEENVSLGYHAIEFLLWGQDLYEDSPGRRPASDFLDGMRDHADRRRAYVTAATDILVSDLAFLESQWAPSATNYRTTFVALDAHEGLTRIFTGLLNLSGFELSGERLLVAWRSSEQEDEHSCFSDTTTQDALYDQIGIQNAYLGRYTRIDDTVLEGPSLSSLVAARDPALDTQIRTALQASTELCDAIPEPFDQALIDDDTGRPAIRAAIDALQAQTELLNQAAVLLGVEVEIAR